MSNLITTDETESPVTRDEAKLFARVDYNDEDILFDALLVAATEVVETLLGRPLLTKEYKFYCDEFENEIVIPMPWESVDSVEYLDSDGLEQTLDAESYQANCKGLKTRVKPAYNRSFPATRAGAYNAVTITGTAGFGDASDVPKSIKTAINILVNTWFNQRETIVVGLSVMELPRPATIDYCLGPWKVVSA